MQELKQGFRLSPQQKRLWLLQRDSAAFRAQCSVTLEGRLDRAALKGAARRLVARHEILRTAFESLPGMRIPVQLALEEAEPAWADLDLTGFDPRRQDEALEECTREQRALPFDFAFGAEARFTLARLGADRHVLLLTLPALCADARSLANFFEQLAAGYEAERLGTEEAVEPVQYVQFSEWQRELLQDEEGEEGRAFWRARSAEAVAAPALPLEARDADLSFFAPEKVSVEVGADLREKIARASGRLDTTTPVFMLACWQLLIWRLTGQAEVPVGLLCEGRVFEEMRDALGLYARWPFVQSAFAEGERFDRVLRRVGETVREAEEWQEYFSHELFRAADGRPGVYALPLGFDFTAWSGPRTAAGVRFALRDSYCCTERFKLRLSCVSAGESLRVEIHYDQNLYDARAVADLSEQFVALLRGAADAPKTSVEALDILGDAQRERLLKHWNRTAGEFRADACLQDLFREQAARTPDAPAIVWPGQRLTFAELDRRSDRLAHLLRARGVGDELRVALLLERSPAQLVAVLAAWKAGAAYVPLDPAQPAPRLAFMLADSEAALVLCTPALAAALPEGAPPSLLLDEGGEQATDVDSDEVDGGGEDSHIDAGVTPANLAYVIYTSGSTGRPKGALVTHRSVSNLLSALRPLVYEGLSAGGTRAGLRVSLNAPLSFDSSVKQLVQLLAGHSLCIVPEEVRPDGAALLSYLDEMGVEVFDCTPSQLRLLLAAGLGLGHAPHPLRAVLLGGEAVDAATWDEVSRIEGIRFYNLYGPTECTVDTTACEIDGGVGPHLGATLLNVEAYVLDSRGEPVPAGVEGELWVGGEGVCRGYTSGGAQTAERFVPDAFSGRAGARLYRTGDVVRRGAGGRLEYVGRADGQVKVRGSRVELGEVEAALRGHARVRDAAAAVRESAAGDMRLVAYVVLDPEQTPSISDLRNYVRQHLPEYMVPTAFVLLDELPLTRNGKVDRAALPAPEQSRPAGEAAGAGPRTPAEEVLCGVWEHLLGVERVGVTDNFFELGGHSLLAMQLLSRVRTLFAAELPLRALFESPTVEGLAALLATSPGADALAPPPLRRREGDSPAPLSFAQQRLWFLYHFDPHSPAYNIPVATRLRGPLDIRALRRTLTEVVRRHESLRTRFGEQGGLPVQIVEPPRAFPLPLIDLSHLGEATRAAEARRLEAAEARLPFDLSRGPMLRGFLLRLGDEEHVALLTMHHIVSDGWSMSILTREVAALYEAFSRGRPSPLPDLPIQYADYAVWQRGWLQGEVLERHLDYWRRQLAGAPERLELPSDRPRPAVQGWRGATRGVDLGAGLTARLRALGRAEGATPFMVMVAGFVALLHRYSGQQDVVVGTGTANREREEVEGLIGFFVNTLVLRTDMGGAPTFREAVRRVREVTLGAYAHQGLPFEALVEDLQPQRNTSYPPLFQAMIVFQNTPRKASGVSDLVLSSKEIENGTAKFDLYLVVGEVAGSLLAVLEYNTDLFNDSTIERMLRSFKTLLEGVGENPDQEVRAVSLVPEEESLQLVADFNED